MLLRLRLACLVLLFFSSLAIPFGKNKVTHRVQKWRTLRSAHFTIYFDSSLEQAAQRCARYAEYLAVRYAAFLQHDLSQNIPIILFASHADFEENHITPYMVGEQTGGFTELLKNRVVLPFEGSYARLYRILAHELVHAFQFDILFGRAGNPFGRLITSAPPLWFLEGMAEYLSLGWDDQSEIIIRDGIFEGTLPTLLALHRGRITHKQYFLVYKLGQAFLHYLTETYGKHTVGRLITLARGSNNFDKVLSSVCGKGLKALSRDFDQALKRHYWPAFTAYRSYQDVFRRKTNHVRDGSSFNYQPVLSPDGKKLAYLSNRSFYPALLIMDTKTGKTLRTIAVAWRNNDYVGLVLERNGMSWSKDGKRLVFLSRKGGRDVIRVYSFPKNRIVHTWSTPCLELSDPAFSPSGNRIAFCGARHGRSGIWLLETNTGRVRPLHEDAHTYRNTCWLDSNQLLLLSNYGREPTDKRLELFVYDLRQGRLSPLSRRPSVAPTCFDVRGNKMIFSGGKGSSDLFLYNLDSGRQERLTRLTGGAYYPHLSVDGKQLAFSLYSKHGYDVCVADLPKLRRLARTNSITATNTPPDGTGKGSNTATNIKPQGAPTYFHNRLKQDTRRLSGFRHFFPIGKTKQYHSALNMDLVNGIVGFNSAAGLRLIGQLAMSDMTGEQQLYLTMDIAVSLQEQQDEENNQTAINIIANYLLFHGRIDLIVGMFNFSSSMLFYDIESILNSAFIPQLSFSQSGAYALGRYPFSRFSRFDVTWTSMRLKRYFLDFAAIHEANMHILELAYVFDNTMWGFFGPMDGVRVKFSAENAFDLWGKDWSFQRLVADMRAYILFGRRYALALRLSMGTVLGKDREHARFELGGQGSVRGYDFYSIRGENMLLANLELRFPFIDFLALGFPLPLQLGGIRGVLFLDAGAAWNGNPHFTVQEGDRVRLRDLRVGAGVGFRIRFGPFRLRWDFATPFDGEAFLPLEKWRGFFSLGVDF